MLAPLAGLWDKTEKNQVLKYVSLIQSNFFYVFKSILSIYTFSDYSWLKYTFCEVIVQTLLGSAD